MSPKKLGDEGDETQKIEVRLPASLKRQAAEAARRDGDGDIAGWVRGLIRAEVRRLGIEPSAPFEPARVRKGSGR
jgi:hypothetical protein